MHQDSAKNILYTDKNILRKIKNVLHNHNKIYLIIYLFTKLFTFLCILKKTHLKDKQWHLLVQTFNIQRNKLQAKIQKLKHVKYKNGKIFLFELKLIKKGI